MTETSTWQTILQSCPQKTDNILLSILVKIRSLGLPWLPDLRNQNLWAGTWNLPFFLSRALTFKNRMTFSRKLCSYFLYNLASNFPWVSPKRTLESPVHENCFCQAAEGSILASAQANFGACLTWSLIVFDTLFFLKHFILKYSSLLLSRWLLLTYWLILLLPTFNYWVFLSSVLFLPQVISLLSCGSRCYPYTVLNPKLQSPIPLSWRWLSLSTSPLPYAIGILHLTAQRRTVQSRPLHKCAPSRSPLCQCHTLRLLKP